MGETALVWTIAPPNQGDGWVLTYDVEWGDSVHPLGLDGQQIEPDTKVSMPLVPVATAEGGNLILGGEMPANRRNRWMSNFRIEWTGDVTQDGGTIAGIVRTFQVAAMGSPPTAVGYWMMASAGFAWSPVGGTCVLVE